MAGFASSNVASICSTRNDLKDSDSINNTSPTNPSNIPANHTSSPGPTTTTTMITTTPSSISNKSTDVSTGIRNVVGWLKQVITMCSFLGLLCVTRIYVYLLWIISSSWIKWITPLILRFKLIASKPYWPLCNICRVMIIVYFKRVLPVLTVTSKFPYICVSVSHVNVS